MIIQYRPVPINEVFSFTLAILIFFINLIATATLCPLNVYTLLSNPIFLSSLSCFVLFLDLSFISLFRIHFLISAFSFSLSLNVFRDLSFTNSINHLSFKVLLFIFEILNFIPLTNQNPSKITINVPIMLSFKS